MVQQWQNVAYPRKARASNPATPASKRASAAGPPFSYVSLASGASACTCVHCVSMARREWGVIKGSSLKIDHVEKHLRRHDQHVRRHTVARHAVLCKRKEACVRKQSLTLGSIGDVVLHSSTALSKPSCSFCAMAYIITSWFIAVRMLRFGRLSKNEHGV